MADNIRLPVRSVGGERRSRGIRLPDAGDVQQVPGQRDPGIAFGRDAFSSAAAFGAGISEAGERIMAFAERQQKLKDATEGGEGKIEFDSSAMEELRRRQLEDDPSRDNFMKDFQTFLEQRQKEVLEGRTESMSKEGLERLRLNLLGSTQAMVDSAGQLQLKAQQDKAADVIQKQINTWSAQVSRDPGSLDIVLGMAGEGLDEFNGALTPENERRVRTKARENIVVAALGGMIDNKQFGKAEEILKSGRFDEDLLPATREKVQNSIETGRKRAESELRADVQLELADEVASIRETGAGIGLSRERIRAAYPDKADRIFKMLGEEKAFFQAKSSVALNSPEEDQKLITSLTPQGEGFKVEAERRDAVLKAIGDKYRSIAQDPAGYALAASPDVKNAFTAASKDPEQMPRALAILDQTQERLGVPPHLRSVLSDAEAKATVQALTLGSAEAGADRIQAMAQQYGEYWPTAYRDLVRAKLPSSYRVLATVDNPVARKALSEALKTEAQDKGALRKGMGEDAKSIDESVASGLAEFRSSMGHAPDGAMVSGDVEEAAKLLAYRYAGTMNPSDAARRAVDDLVGKYSFIQDSRHNARAPKGAADLAEDRSNKILASLKAEDMPDPGGNKDLSPERRRDIALSAAKRGTWITNETDDGWLLVDVNGQPVMRRKQFTDEGRPIIHNPDGSISTEETITVEVDELNGGKPTNIPTIWGGKRLKQEMAINNAIQAAKTGKSFPSFATVDDAVTSAKARSESLGAQDRFERVEFKFSDPMPEEVPPTGSLNPNSDAARRRATVRNITVE